MFSPLKAKLPSPALLALLMAILLAGCSPGEDSPTVPQATEETPVPSTPDVAWYASGSEAERGDAVVYRSPADDRGYRYLTLENGLAVLLVSDPEADKAAASLSVNVGSFDNPREREGLAHFLEHMLFLGTDRFPEAGEYQAFISEHGGTHNAYTSLEETNYFFEVDAAHLSAALDRFSRFFVAPLFTPEFVDRERHAVDSEYHLGLRDDGRREWDVLRELANPGHPLSLFSVGNLDTLEDREGRPVRDDLLDFYERYYCASLMTLVVLGREDLDALEAMARDRFAEVPNRDAELPLWDEPLFDRDLPFRVFVTPEKELRQLSINFPLPPVSPFWAVKPTDFLAHLLGHEGEGTLLAELKRLGLAESLMAGLAFDSRGDALFSVSIGLTEAGILQHEGITQAFFDWLALVTEQGLEQWRYDEVANLSQVAFRFADKQRASATVRRLSTLMHHYPPAEVLRGPHYFRDFDLAVITDFAARLRPDNAFVSLVAGGFETDQKTRYYQVPFRVEPLTVDDIASQGAPVLADLALALPQPNEFIPENLVVLEDPEAAPVPRSVAEGGHGQELWHYLDQRFNSPRALFEARIAIPGLEDLRRETLLDLYRAMVADQLSSRTYPAAQAGLGFSIGRWDSGLSLRVQGYSEKQSLLLEEIVAAMASPEWDEARFERLRNQMMRQWRNTTRDWPISQVIARLSPLLRDTWLPLEKAEALESLTLEDMQAFAAEIFSQSHARFYAGGNLDESAAITLASLVSDGLSLGGGEEAIPVDYRVRRLAAADPLATVPVFVEQGDNAALLFLQGTEDSLEERARFALLQKLAEAPFYSELRTERQLGYVVGSGISPMHLVPGLIFYVQSPGHDPDSLREEIDGFLSRYQARLQDFSGEDFERIRQAVLAGIEEQPRSVLELGARHLESLNLGFTDFDFRDRLAAAIRAQTLDDVQAAYRRVLLGSRRGVWLVTSRDPADSDLDRESLGGIMDGVYSYPQ